MRIVPVLALTVSCILAVASAHAAEITAEELVRKIIGARTSSGEIVRARMEVADTASDRRTAMQVRIRIRHDGGGVTRSLYQVLWPTARMGEALYLESGDGGEVSGFVFERPDKVTSLTPALIAGPCLGTDLNVEDLLGDFWRWPTQTICGSETIDREPCRIIESRPAPDAHATVALVRSWVSPTKLVALRIEKLGTDGRVMRRFVFKRIVKSDDLWVPRVMVVQTPESTQETTLEISRGERDVEIPLEDFSLEAVKRFAATGDESPSGERKGPAGKQP